MRRLEANKLVVGWREWIALPDLGIERVKVKVDTGARTSALHAFNIRPFRKKAADWVQFEVHPMQANEQFVRSCACTVLDYRWVMDSGGKREKRFVIKTPIFLGSKLWPIEITLTARDQMRFRMLLGRHAMKNRIIVDPSRSYCTGKLGPGKATPVGFIKPKKKSSYDEEE